MFLNCPSFGSVFELSKILQFFFLTVPVLAACLTCSYFDRVLEMRRTPLAVGRKLSLRKELLPLATERMKRTSYSEGSIGNVADLVCC